MKNWIIFGIALAVLAALGLTSAPTATADDAATFTVARLVVCNDVVDREPILGSEEHFSLAADKVYCFLEARDISVDTDVQFVWIYQDREQAVVPVTLRKGSRWRTNSSKRLGNMSGDWKVELRDSTGTVIDSVSFTVQ